MHLYTPLSGRSNVQNIKSISDTDDGEITALSSAGKDPNLLGWLLNDDVIVYCGGGGAGRSGVTNTIVAARVDLASQTIHKLQEHQTLEDEGCANGEGS